jgi:hypothetical protein
MVRWHSVVMVSRRGENWKYDQFWLWEAVQMAQVGFPGVDDPPSKWN